MDLNDPAAVKILSLPYGRGTVPVTFPEGRSVYVVQTKKIPVAGKMEREIIADSLQNPIGSKRLRELTKGCKNVVIIASDHTRPVPSRIIIPLLLDEIRSGNPDAHVTILVATGCHRPTTQAELLQKFGEAIMQTENITIHDCDDADNLSEIGILPSGGACIINRIAAEADLLVSEGFIEPHFFAGFSGGRKSVMPGVASRRTVLENHNSSFISDIRSRQGVLDGNLIHQDMQAAARMAKLGFICNVVLDEHKRVAAAFSGDMDEAHLRGAAFVSHYFEASAPQSDIVVVTNGGYPLDQNIYQCVKGLTAAEAVCRPGGVIILLAACEDGHGGNHFYHDFTNTVNLDTLADRIEKTPKGQTQPDQWQSQIFCRILCSYKVIMVTDAPRDMVESLHMSKADSFEDALVLADQFLQGKNETISVIPDGVSVIIRTGV